MPEQAECRESQETPEPGEATAPSRRDVAVAILAAIGLQLAAWAALYYAFGVLHLGYRFFDLTDIVVYIKYAGRMAAGQIPYVDFLLEYPPLVVPFLALPGRPDVPAAYAVRFALEMLAVASIAAAITSVVALRASGRLRAGLVTAGWWAACILAIGAIAGNRFDLAVALVFAALLLALAERRWTLAAAVLGLGFALKLTPVVLVPLVLILAGDLRRAARAAGAFTATALAPFAVYASYGMLGITGLATPFTYNLGRPLEIESVLATPLLIANRLGALPLRVVNTYGSQALASPVADAFAASSTWLTLAAFAALYALVWSRRGALRARPEHLAAPVLAAVLTFMAPCRVLSPQYLIWLLPMAALLLAERRASGWLLLGALALTHVLFPANYLAFTRLETWPVLLVAARNAVLLAVLALSVREIAALPRQAARPGAAETA